MAETLIKSSHNEEGMEEKVGVVSVVMVAAGCGGRQGGIRPSPG